MSSLADPGQQQFASAKVRDIPNLAPRGGRACRFAPPGLFRAQPFAPSLPHRYGHSGSACLSLASSSCDLQRRLAQ
jgi:hypothetical protein